MSDSVTHQDQRENFLNEIHDTKIVNNEINDLNLLESKPLETCQRDLNSSFKVFGVLKQYSLLDKKLNIKSKDIERLQKNDNIDRKPNSYQKLGDCLSSSKMSTAINLLSDEVFEDLDREMLVIESNGEFRLIPR